MLANFASEIPPITCNTKGRCNMNCPSVHYMTMCAGMCDIGSGQREGQINYTNHFVYANVLLASTALIICGIDNPKSRVPFFT
jgi:hypothetical protein